MNNKKQVFKFVLFNTVGWAVISVMLIGIIVCFQVLVLHQDISDKSTSMIILLLIVLFTFIAFLVNLHPKIIIMNLFNHMEDNFRYVDGDMVRKIREVHKLVRTIDHKSNNSAYTSVINSLLYCMKNPNVTDYTLNKIIQSINVTNSIVNEKQVIDSFFE